MGWRMLTFNAPREIGQEVCEFCLSDEVNMVGGGCRSKKLIKRKVLGAGRREKQRERDRVVYCSGTRLDLRSSRRVPFSCWEGTSYLPRNTVATNAWRHHLLALFTLTGGATVAGLFDHAQPIIFYYSTT